MIHVSGMDLIALNVALDLSLANGMESYMENYRLVIIRVQSPLTYVKVKEGFLTEGVEPGTKSIYSDMSNDTISMPVGTIYLNYIPDSYCATVPTSGSLYCLVPDWEFKEAKHGK